MKPYSKNEVDDLEIRRLLKSYFVLVKDSKLTVRIHFNQTFLISVFKEFIEE